MPAERRLFVFAATIKVCQILLTKQAYNGILI